MGKRVFNAHTDGKVGGYLVGRKHTHGGIKATNVDTNEPIELESEEVVITAPAVKSSQKHEFDGQHLTNLEILDRINVSGGGVGLMKRGGKVKEALKVRCCGKSYKYGGRMLTDREIVKEMEKGCKTGSSRESRTSSSAVDDEYLDERDPEPLDSSLESTHAELIMAEGGKLMGTNGYDQQPLIDLIMFYLSLPGSRYITAIDSQEQRITIRVSDHNSNARNFGPQEQHVSFISKNERNPANPLTVYEFVVEDEDAIHDILEDYDIVAYYDGHEKKRLKSVNDAKEIIESAQLEIPDYVMKSKKTRMEYFPDNQFEKGGHTCGCSHDFPHHLLPVHYEGGGQVPADLNEIEEETLNFLKKHPYGYVRFHAKRTDISRLLSSGLVYKTHAPTGFYTDVFLTEKGARTLSTLNLVANQEIMASGGKTKTIKDKVLNAQEELKAMATHTELRNWALSNGMDNRSAFPKFKDALKEIGIDYEAIRSGIRKEQEENLISKIKHQVTLYVDAKASQDRFAVTDENGNVLWYGKFFDNDQDYNGEQSSGELAAAKKAVWLASKIKEAVGDEAIKLILFVDAQWLTYQDHPGQKGYVLTQLSKKYNVDLDVEWIPGTDNPADKWTISSGYKKWSDNDLSSLVKPVESDQELVDSWEEESLAEIPPAERPILEIGTPQEAAPAGKFFKGILFQYANPYDLNRAIEELLDSTPGIDFTVDEKVFLKYYSGYGGLEKYGATGVGLLYEYFTPGAIAKKMWGLAYKFGYDGGSVFEPSCGIGEFFNYAPLGVPKTGYEINPYSARICKILHPDVNVEQKAFEQKFIKGRDTVRNRIDTMPTYDLVIGNPPYGNFQGKFAGMGEKAYTKASNYIDYFIFRGLDLLRPGGLLIFIIGAEVQAGGIPFLQQQDNPIKREIAGKADLLDAYRLPNGVFERTDVLTDIIVLQKKQ